MTVTTAFSELESWCTELLELEESYFGVDKESKKRQLSDQIF